MNRQARMPALRPRGPGPRAGTLLSGSSPGRKGRSYFVLCSVLCPSRCASRVFLTTDFTDSTDGEKTLSVGLHPRPSAPSAVHSVSVSAQPFPLRPRARPRLERTRLPLGLEQEPTKPNSALSRCEGQPLASPLTFIGCALPYPKPSFKGKLFFPTARASSG